MAREEASNDPEGSMTRDASSRFVCDAWKTPWKAPGPLPLGGQASRLGAAVGELVPGGMLIIQPHRKRGGESSSGEFGPLSRDPPVCRTRNTLRPQGRPRRRGCRSRPVSDLRLPDQGPPERPSQSASPTHPPEAAALAAPISEAMTAPTSAATTAALIAAETGLDPWR